MKKLSFFIENSLKVLLLLGLLFHVQNSNLYAQDQELFEYTWYLDKIVLHDNNEQAPIPNEDVPFISLWFDSDNLSTVVCNEFIAELIFEGDASFSISHAEMTLLECEPVENYYFEQIQFGFFLTPSLNAIEEPFLYQIFSSEEIKTLTVTNIRGDEAIYKSQFLSNTQFTLYPNPVKETLHITTTANQAVNAAIYDLNGKLIQNHAIENKTTTLDVKNLKQGVYFIVFETETRERLSKKFVKQ
jgi:hypothetical protein